jgi:hypothetical protein
MLLFAKVCHESEALLQYLALSKPMENCRSFKDPYNDPFPEPDDSNPNCHSMLLYSPSCDTLRAFVSFAVLFGPDILLTTAATPTP